MRRKMNRCVAVIIISMLCFSAGCKKAPGDISQNEITKAPETDTVGGEQGMQGSVSGEYEAYTEPSMLQALVQARQLPVIEKRLPKRTDVVTVDGNMIDLSYKEFELLEYFMQNKGIALSREKILNHVWNYDYFGDARTIDTHVKKLGSKLGEKGELIVTIWGMGYKFECE